MGGGGALVWFTAVGAKKSDVRYGRRTGSTGGLHTVACALGAAELLARVEETERLQSVLWARCGGGSCGTIALSRDYSSLQTCPPITGAGSFKIRLSSSRLETRIKESCSMKSILVSNHDA
jgi:hypothetical protein